MRYFTMVFVLLVMMAGAGCQPPPSATHNATGTPFPTVEQTGQAVPNAPSPTPAPSASLPSIIFPGMEPSDIRVEKSLNTQFTSAVIDADVYGAGYSEIGSIYLKRGPIDVAVIMQALHANGQSAFSPVESGNDDDQVSFYTDGRYKIVVNEMFSIVSFTQENLGHDFDMSMENLYDTLDNEKCTITAVEAYEQAVDLFKKIGYGDAQLLECHSYGKSDEYQTGFFRLKFAFRVNGLPLIWQRASLSQGYNKITMGHLITVIVGDQGVLLFEISGVREMGEISQPMPVIPYTQALLVFEKNLDRYPAVVEGNTFTKITLIYFPLFQQHASEAGVEYIPVWNISEGNNFTTNRYRNVYVNAYTGEIIQ